MRETGYYIQNNYIYGPSFGGQFYISGGYIYGPTNNGVYKVNGDGTIYGPNGQLTDFRLQGKNICGPSGDLPWFS